MTTLKEDNLQITVNGALSVRKFDDEASHGLSHCMKAVDFIIELDDHYAFIEFKDPQNPRSRDRDRERFLRSFHSGQLDEDFKYKYRDSFLYEWASGRAEKPVYFFVLVALDTLDSIALNRRTDELKDKLPLSGHGQESWPRPIAAGCAVFNIDSWNKNFPQYPVTRLP